MKSDVILVILLFGGFAIGAVVGMAFGSIQAAAHDRYRRLQQHNRLTNVATIIPGSLRRIAFLLVALVSIQIAFPMFFEREGMQWVVSAGIVVGYGLALLRQASGRQMSRI